MPNPLLDRVAARHRLILSLIGAVLVPALVVPACTGGAPEETPEADTFTFTSAPTEVRAGQSVSFKAEVRTVSGKPSGTGSPQYYILDATDQQYANIDQNTGVLTAATSIPVAERTIKVNATGFGILGPLPQQTSITVRTRVTQLTASAPTTTLTVGGATTQGTAAVSIAPGSPSSPAPTVTWTSSAPTVVSVSSTGVIAALQATTGTPVSITATSEGITSAPILITSNAAPSIALVVTPKTLTMSVGNVGNFVATLVNATGTIAWTSRDSNVVALNAPTTGSAVTARAKAPGNVYLVASFTSGATTYRDSSLVTVVAAPAASVVITPKTATAAPGQALNFVASVTNPTAGATLDFVSTVPTVGDFVSQGGGTGGGTAVVKAGTVAGTTQIIARYRNGTTLVAADTATLTVQINPTIAFNPNPVTVGVAGTTQLTTTVSNPVAGGTLALVVRPSGFATYSASTNNNTTAVGSVVGSAAGTTYLVATYTAGTIVYRDSVRITVGSTVASRVARVVLEPRDQEVTAPTPFTYRPRFLDASGATLTAADVAADGGTVRFFNTSDAVATVVPLTTDPTQAQVTPKGAGTENVTVTYTKSGQTIASDNSNLTVYAAGTAGHYGSLTISTGGNVRQLKVGETVAFQVVVRDVNSVIQTTGVTGLIVTSSDTSILTVARDGDPSGYFYTMTGKAPGVVIVKADVAGAATSIPIVVTP